MSIKQIIGRGIFGWCGSERRSDRYGAFAVMEGGYDDNGHFPGAGWDSHPEKLAGQQCQIVAVVLESRVSGHIGDVFRGIGPSQPEVGEVIDLRTGTLFLADWDFALGVGLKPADGRASDWLDPVKLYRLALRPREPRRQPVIRDIALFIALMSERTPVAIHDFDDDAASVVEVDHIELVDVTDLDNPILITTSGARFRVCITREG